MGRPTKYSKKKLKLAEELARKGNTNKEIAAKLNIAESVFYEWCKKYPEFSEVIKKAREEYAIPEVEGALFKLATGYWIEEKRKIGIKTKKKTEDNAGNTEEDNEGLEKVRMEIIEKYIPPNPTAIIFFLKNRAPDRWKDRREIEAHGKIGVLEVEADVDEEKT